MHRSFSRGLLLVVWLGSILALPAPTLRRVPAAGIPLPEEARRQLVEAARRFETDIGIAQLRWERGDLGGSPPRTLPAWNRLDLLSDVRVFHKAVHWALRYDEFHKTNEIELARELLREGQHRLQSLRAGQAPWLTATGRVVRGYISQIDEFRPALRPRRARQCFRDNPSAPP